MLPGGGAQYAGMGRELYDSEPVYRSVIDDCAAAARPTLGVDLRSVLYPDGDLKLGNKYLERPSIALPALFATEYAMAKLLESWGIAPTAMIGHSAGEAGGRASRLPTTERSTSRRPAMSRTDARATRRGTTRRAC